ncbi:MAG: hypothetical protein R3C03_12525 [Pirellulaceae bacterium]
MSRLKQSAFIVAGLFVFAVGCWGTTVEGPNLKDPHNVPGTPDNGSTTENDGMTLDVK